MHIISRRDDGSVDEVAVEPRDLMADEAFEAALDTGATPAQAFTRITASFPDAREYLCWKAELPLPHKLDDGDAPGTFKCLTCGWSGEESHVPASEYGDLNITRRCYRGEHEKCFGTWTCYPDGRGACECGCHVNHFPRD